MICVEYLFPKTPVSNDLPQAMKMRAGIIPIILGHLLCMVLGVAFVSVFHIVGQLFYIAMLYSTYMTLHPWLVWTYLIILGINAVSGIFSVWLLSGAPFVVSFIIVIYYFLACYTIYYSSLPFRSLGESNGNGGNSENFYFEAGIRHMVASARNQYGDYLRAPGVAAAENNRDQPPPYDNER